MKSFKFIFTLLLIGFASSQMSAQRMMTREAYIKFFSSTSVEDIEAASNQASSVLEKNTGKIAFQVLMTSFSFEKALMQEHFNENYVESETYPKATFAGQIEDLSKVDFETEGTYTVSIKGTLTVHGVAQERTVSATIKVDGENVLLETVFEVQPADHDIEIPSVVRDNIARELEVTVKAKYAPLN
ncbi:MAG: YceI family protein [Flavobacteriia bacterium]|nr:YceI family protein [Flavobacteriia bacterium]